MARDGLEAVARRTGLLLLDRGAQRLDAEPRNLFEQRALGREMTVDGRMPHPGDAGDLACHAELTEEIDKLTERAAKASARGDQNAASKAESSIATYTTWLDQAKATLADFTR